MGHAIALTLARAGHRVALADPFEEALRAAPKRIRDGMCVLGASGSETTETLERIALYRAVPAAVRGVRFVFEDAPEKRELKRRIFVEAQAHAPAEAVLASNTSVSLGSEIPFHSIR